jgi:hypothetical protein
VSFLTLFRFCVFLASPAALTASAHLLNAELIPRQGTSTNKASRRDSAGLITRRDKVSAFVTTGFFAARKGRWKDNRNMKNNSKSAAIAAEEPAKLSQLGLVVLTQLYDDITTRNYEEATGLLEGLGELIEHNPALQPEARAMRQIAEGERVLNSLRARKYAL